jgi:hypothetical protein
MSIHSQQQRPPMSGLGALLFLAGCATGTPMQGSATTGHHPPSHYAQSADSATNGCLRNPACYTQTGDEAIIPWLSRTTSAARTTTAAAAMMLKDADIKLVEQRLLQCAREANEKAHKEDKELQGREPDREYCQKVVRREGKTEVTRAMELGARKHELALDCARSAFKELFARNIQVEPTYQKDPTTGLWRWLDPTLVKEWLEIGLKSYLWGSLVPDFVIHAPGNPNQIQRVYDFKFPCPSGKDPSWRRYDEDHPHFPKDQKRMYKDALLGGKGDPQAVTPNGVK